MNLGNTFKEIRKVKFSDNQEAFALKLGITQSYLSGIENNKKKASPDLITKLSEISDIPKIVILGKSITIEDVADDKKEAFKSINESMQNLINEFFITPDCGLI